MEKKVRSLRMLGLTMLAGAIYDWAVGLPILFAPGFIIGLFGLPFGANRFVNGSIEIALDKCYGCGLCVSACPTEARRMVGREGYSNTFYPLDLVNRLS